jgi:two-component system response regulator FixJ
LDSGHRIGIIDDDPAVRDSIRTLLEARGYQVSEYGSATDYLSHPGADSLLLVDLSMADLNGMDLIELLRSSNIKTPVILLTDIAEPSLSQRISAVDRCKRLNKPAGSHDLLQQIASMTATAPSHP